MLFIGIDLAWSTKNGSGIAVIEENKIKSKLLSADLTFSDKDIIEYVKEKTKNGNSFIAIDAPLIVPNESGRRKAEEIVGSLFRKYNAGAHPSNRKRLSQWSGKIRGEEISKLLEKEGFKQDPYIKRFEESRKFFEVYPHPSMVVLFKLNKIIPYKAKPKRDYESRWSAFEKYQSLMKGLKKSNTPLELGDILKTNVRKLKAQKLKDYEDRLDAVFCAYIAYYNWANPEKCEVLGSMNEGYILTPISESIREQIKNQKAQKILEKF